MQAAVAVDAQVRDRVLVHALPQRPHAQLALAEGVQVVSVSPPRKIDFDDSGMSFSDTVDPLDVVVYKISARKGVVAVN